MFDIAPSELLIVAVVALIAIGPKDLPMALRTAGRWLGKVRRVSGHFRAGVETMIREAELAEIEKEWQERNQRIMAEHPDAAALDASLPPAPDMEPMRPPSASAEAAVPAPDTGGDVSGEPQLPVPPPPAERD
ncbi:Sec-independent protein translocase protein TatB [Qipengyuania sediminis]|uniref:Sec-independent protein translocase protein TatB n=1 Tax=Qipengyuania sediminis TaxID=1532023 RepID=UPI00105AAB87|nr:Sec-independent protein translocase protein TatB [Qipengyuania sediminis]